MSFDAFVARAAPGTLVPVWRDCLLDTETAVGAFHRLRQGPFALLRDQLTEHPAADVPELGSLWTSASRFAPVCWLAIRPMCRRMRGKSGA